MKNLTKTTIMYRMIMPCIFLLYSCSGNQNLYQNSLQPIKYQYKTQAKKSYFASYDFRGHFEISINGVLIKSNRKDDVVIGIENLNPFIAKTGSQHLTLVLKPIKPGLKIDPKDVKNYFIDIVSNENDQDETMQNVIRCSFEPIDHPVDSLAQTWTFKAEVPYVLAGLENAQDLTRENKASLMAEVLEYYKNMHQIINQGNEQAYFTGYQKSLNRQIISMYYDEAKQKKYIQSLANRFSSSKGVMQPLDGYVLFIHPDGKLAGLVKQSGTGSPLYSRDDEQQTRIYGLELYRPKTGGKLEIY